MTPLEEIFDDASIRELIKRRKWVIEACDSGCLIYARYCRHNPDDYSEVLDEVKRVVAALLPTECELDG